MHLEPAFTEDIGVPSTVVESRRHRLRSGCGSGRRRRRYAAVIGVAFVAGFAARALMPAGSKVPPVTPPAAESPAAWEQRFADLYLHHPSESSLARSLVAVAHLTSRETPPANGP